jgi:hypothetical protein
LSAGAWGLSAVSYMAKKSAIVHIRGGGRQHTASGSDLNVESGDAQFLAANSDVLGCQHGGVWGGLVTIGLDLHAAGNTADSFAATGITQNISLTIPLYNDHETVLMESLELF